MKTFKDVLENSFGLEARNALGKQREIEFTIYAKVKDINRLDTGETREQHEQWNLPFDNCETVRARIRAVNQEDFTLTTKQKDGGYGLIENTTALTKDAYIALRSACIDGYNKLRFTFPIEGSDLIWEIDAFYNQMGNLHDWVKIDLEVKDINTQIPHFPIEVEEVIYSDSPSLSPEDDRWIKRLWDVEWQRIDGTRKDLEGKTA